mmetsp:Transcript_21644/g.40779  ORF Transcript_21644/g.40779 Transcript_21644/m.40779 type:complete len:175 (-) Transcript_21644:44-568(-)
MQERIFPLAALVLLGIWASHSSAPSVAFWLTQRLVAIFLIAAALDKLTAKLPPSIVQDPEQRVWARISYGFTGHHASLLTKQRMKLMRSQRGSRVTVVSAGFAGHLTFPKDLYQTSAHCRCCHGEFEENCAVAVLPCGHSFCEDCIAEWALSGHAMSATCPLCRENFGVFSEAS